MMPRFRMPPGPPPGAPPSRLMHPHHNKFGPQHPQQPPVSFQHYFSMKFDFFSRVKICKYLIFSSNQECIATTSKRYKGNDNNYSQATDS